MHAIQKARGAPGGMLLAAAAIASFRTAARSAAVGVHRPQSAETGDAPVVALEDRGPLERTPTDDTTWVALLAATSAEAHPVAHESASRLRTSARIRQSMVSPTTTTARVTPADSSAHQPGGYRTSYWPRIYL